MTDYFEINGGNKLKGSVTINGSKNAAVALIMGALINKGKTTLKNVPQIEEVYRLKEVMESIGVKFEAKEKELTIIVPKKIAIEKINKVSAERTRSIILMIGALAGRQKKYFIPQAGGCRLGSRTIKPHLFALENLGIKIKAVRAGFEVDTRNLKSAKKIVQYESGDTVTENILLAASQTKGKTIVHMASANYQVQDLCFFLEKLGVKIKGIGTTTLEIEGKKNINKNIIYEISEDPIEAMFFLAVAIVTQSQLKLQRCPIEFLELELLKLEKMGFKYKILKEYLAKNAKTKLIDIETYPSKLIALEEKIYGRPFPGLNIDNLPFFVPIVAFAKGKTLIHDWVFEDRAGYFVELNKLGMKIKLSDVHRVEVFGPSQLKGTEMVCPPALRPGAIILVAMLAAKGKSKLKEIYHIERGYKNLVERLHKLGADIKRVKSS